MTFFFLIKFRVSPPGGDFSDPVTSATLGIVQVYLFYCGQLLSSPSHLCPPKCYPNHQEVFNVVTKE